MKRKLVLFPVILVVTISLVLAACTSAPATPTTPATPNPTPTQTQAQLPAIKWVAQTASSMQLPGFGRWGLGQSGYSQGMVYVSRMVEKNTNGKLTIDWAEPGAIFPITDTDLAVEKGTVDAAYTYGTYHGGRVPEENLITGGVFQWDDDSQAYEWFNDYGGLKLVQDLYAKRNIMWFPVSTDAIVGIGTTFPATSPSDIKGKKIRVTGMWGDAIDILGGTPQNIPWGDVYMAAKLKTIDGWAAGVASLDEVQLKEVASGYVVYPNFSVSMTGFMINMNSWNKLPKEWQKMITDNIPAWGYVGGYNWHNQVLWSIANAEKKYGVKIWRWTEEDKDKIFQKMVTDVYPKYASKTPEGQKMLDLLMKQWKEYGRIK